MAAAEASGEQPPGEGPDAGTAVLADRESPAAGEVAIEAAVFRRLVGHLRQRTDVQNIDLMNLAGFCRNCLGRWYQEEADRRGRQVDRAEARERVYGMPYEVWKRDFQTGATPAQQSMFRTRREEEEI